MSAAPAHRGEWVPGYVPPLAMFLARRVVAAPGLRLDWAEVYRAFAGDGWRSQPPAKAFGQAMAYICRAKGVRIEVDGGNIYCPDMQLTA